MVLKFRSGNAIKIRKIAECNVHIIFGIFSLWFTFYDTFSLWFSLSIDLFLYGSAYFILSMVRSLF